MVGQILLIPVDPDQVFERAGDPGFLVRLQLGQVNDHVRFDHLFRHKVLMTSGSVCSCQEARIITSDTESIPTMGDWFEKTVSTQVEKHETFFRLEALSRQSHTVDKDTSCPPEVPDSLERRLDPHQTVGPGAKSCDAQETLEVAALYGRVPDQDFRRSGAERSFNHGAD